ncbi:MAG: class E sortase [Micrococcales bacterium]|nr:class E sortase [Micrococcales bacterium]
MSDGEPATRVSVSRARRRQRRRLSVIGVIGELLITAGFLVFLFLGWQLWLNDIIVGNEQNHAAAELANSWTSGNVSLNQEDVPTNFGEPVVTPVPDNAVTFAVMYVPRFGADWVREVAEGIGVGDVLDTKRIGHYPTTQAPGEVGNMAFAAHRLTYGAPFKDINQLQLGDKLYVQTKDGYFTYSFRNLEYVSPRQVDVLDPVPQEGAAQATDRILTIMSCNPKWSTAERIIAYSVLDSWQPISAGPPAAIASLASSKG